MAEKDVELSEVGRRGSLTFALEESEQQAEAKFDSPSLPRYVPPPPGVLATDGGDSEKREAGPSIMVDKDAIAAIFRNPIAWIACLVVAGVAALLIVILVPLHFADLDYWQIGFRMRQSTGQVYTDRVYGPGGRYGLTVDYKFKAFPADAHLSVLNNVAVFSSDGLEIFLDVRFQYFIRPSELQPLHDAYDQQYDGIIRARAETVIKQFAPNFNTNQFYENRTEVEQFLARNLFDDLGGVGCCDSYCSGELFDGGYIIPEINCTGCARVCPAQEFHVDSRYFQLLEVRIPSDVSQRFLDVIIFQENAEEEQFNQLTTLVNLDITREVQVIMNQALEVQREAEARAVLIRSIANTNATALVEEARTTGLSLIYDRLGITDPRHKASLDYLRTLRRSSTNARLHVGFDKAISGPN